MPDEVKDTASGTKTPDDINPAAHFLGMEDDPEPVIKPNPFLAGSQDVPKAPVQGMKSNVVLSSARLDDALPKGQTNIGRCGVVLPDVETQAQGFYLEPEKAARLVAQFGQYKFLVDKGQATPTIRIGE